MHIDISSKKAALSALRGGLDCPPLVDAVSSEKYELMESFLKDNLANGFANVHYVVGEYGTGKTTLLGRLQRFYEQHGNAHVFSTRIVGERYGDVYTYLTSIFLLEGRLPALLRRIGGASAQELSGVASPQIRLIIDLAGRLSAEEDDAFYNATSNWLNGTGIMQFKTLATKYGLIVAGPFETKKYAKMLVSSLAVFLRTKNVRLVLFLDELDGIKLYNPSRQTPMLDALRLLYDDAVLSGFDLYLFATPDLVEVQRYPALADRLMTPMHLISVRSVMWTTLMFHPTSTAYAAKILEWHSECEVASQSAQPTLSLATLLPLIPVIFEEGKNLRTCAKDLLALIDLYYVDAVAFDQVYTTFVKSVEPEQSIVVEVDVPVASQVDIRTNDAEAFSSILDDEDSEVRFFDLFKDTPLTSELTSSKAGKEKDTLPALHSYYSQMFITQDLIEEGFRKCQQPTRLGTLLAKCRDNDFMITVLPNHANNIRHSQSQVAYLVGDLKVKSGHFYITLPGFTLAAKTDIYAACSLAKQRLEGLIHKMNIFDDFVLATGVGLIRAFVYHELAHQQLYAYDVPVDEAVQALLKESFPLLGAPMTISRTGIAFRRKGLFSAKTEWCNPVVEVCPMMLLSDTLSSSTD